MATKMDITATRRVFLLDISHMKLVRDVLKKSHFINANWFDLGEELNLPYPQLKNIEDTYVNNPSRCLRECLNLWLTSANNRTWESLASALERMNQCTAARHIRKITTNTVPSGGIHICKTRPLVFLISIIFLFLSFVINYFYCFSTLVYLCLFFILLSLSLLYCIICSTNRRQSSSSIAPVSIAGGEFFFNAAHKPIFNEVRGSFIILCDELVPLISQSKATVTEVKSFLLKSFPELSAELSNADSIEDIMNVVVQKCCINDISIIKTIVKKFQITEAKPLISEYEKEVKTVCGSLKDFLSLNQPEYFNHSETIQFTLGWQPEEHSLDDIRNLLEEAFKELNKRIIIRSIHRGNSIIIICYAPHHLLAALLLEAQHNLTVLMKEFSLIRLTIGHYTVYDKRIRYKVMNNECLAEEIKLADGKEQELRTLFDYKEGVIVDLLLNY
ncbi:PREDICTED: uncharacterized protein LOC109590594 [Amphimedon queenslandica]|uniref:Death domain-containing protein n=1 Tax=Amphimedon queenslandica TaxID=400682 RepID=A0AAN0JYR3_AMPQE|nr:PREDICTED: uncharacterized protein LOC109590594 [Amphimedon queenslandica]|eukprot:XP_019862050.1 PREDICTED: uncharacterized protein LOC109590594 [Amphimedon queenslandica]